MIFQSSVTFEGTILLGCMVFSFSWRVSITLCLDCTSTIYLGCSWIHVICCRVYHYMCQTLFWEICLSITFPVVLLRWLKSGLRIGDTSFIMSLSLLTSINICQEEDIIHSVISILHHQEMQHNQFRIFYTLKHKVMIMKACRLWCSHSL